MEVHEELATVSSDPDKPSGALHDTHEKTGGITHWLGDSTRHVAPDRSGQRPPLDFRRAGSGPPFRCRSIGFANSPAYGISTLTDLRRIIPPPKFGSSSTTSSRTVPEASGA